MRARVLGAMLGADSSLGWRLADGRALNVRSIEHHAYTPGGSVCDADHCDTGSVLTMSVLLADPAGYDGGDFRVRRAGGRWETVGPLEAGDAVLFPSELVHNVRPIERGFRSSLVVELYEGPITLKNRHN